MKPSVRQIKSPPFQNAKENRHGENAVGSPCEKKARVGRENVGMKVCGTPRVKVRKALNDSNAGNDPPEAATSGPPPELSNDEIEELLTHRIKTKNKFDHKGKSEQLADYTKRLKACIRWLQIKEEGLILEKADLHKQLEDLSNESKKNGSYMVPLLHRFSFFLVLPPLTNIMILEFPDEEFRNRQKELESTITELQNTTSSLKDVLAKVEAEKEALLEAKENEIQARQAAEKLQKALSEELDKARTEISNANHQVATLQDINKRLQEYNASLQLYNSKLQSDAAASAETLSKLQTEKSTIMETLSNLRGHSQSVQEQLTNTKASQQELLNQKNALMDEIDRLRTDLHRVTEERDIQATHVQSLTTEVTRYKECTGKTVEDLERLSTKTSALEEQNCTQSDTIKDLHRKLEIANKNLEYANSAASNQRATEEEQRRTIEDLRKRLDEAEKKITDGELVRRKLHNTILELKGNIRVFCRVRPLLPEEESSESSIMQYPVSSENSGRGIDLVQSPGQKYSFVFDKVFQPDAGQQEVFEEISQLIQSALDGYKVCIFAYGQTGSGKTHTMLGSSDTDNQRGIIPRSLEQIFKSSQSLSSQGWKIKMQASMLEIYNESIRDLLVPNKSSAEASKQYTIKHDQNGNTVVSDLTVVDVTNWNEVSSLLRRASQSRSVGKTAMNEQSSRSHCVFTLRIFGENEGTEQQIHGVLNLIDLAGSERLSRSGSTGDRLKETQAINKSLACLGDVILAIANRDQHVPFRNSKLTYLLQPCLGGDSKTLMFVNISPDPKSFNESLCSLRFAAKVNACDIGVPRRQTHARISESISHF